MQLNPLRFEPTQMEGSKIYYFEETNEWLVIENNKIILVCSSEEEAKSYMPLFKKGDYVDSTLDGNLRNVKITEVGRTMEGDLYYKLHGYSSCSFEQDEIVASLNPPQD